SDRRFGERELLARAPLIGDVVNDERGAYAFDRALLEAVIGVVRRHEDHGRVRSERRASDMALVAVIDVGAEVLVARVPRQVQQPSEGLHAEVGMRLEPEAVDILRELDAEISAFEARAECLLDMARDPLVLEGLRHRLAHRKALAVLDVEIFARIVVQLTLALDAIDGPSLEGERYDVVDRVCGKAILDRPVPIRLVGPFPVLDAFDEAANDIVRRTLRRRLSRTLNRDAFPHDVA